jgi:hypothetical protein
MSMLEFDPLMHAVIVFVIFDLIFGKKYCSGILTLIFIISSAFLLFSPLYEKSSISSKIIFFF